MAIASGCAGITIDEPCERDGYWKHDELEPRKMYANSMRAVFGYAFGDEPERTLFEDLFGEESDEIGPDRNLYLYDRLYEIELYCWQMRAR